MSDLQNPDLNDSEEEPTVTPAPQQGGPKQLRDALDQSNRAKAAAEQEAAQLRRELAIERAQLPNFPGKQFFLQNYNGEATPDAIKAAALAAGFQLEASAPAEPPAPPAPAVPPAELAQHRAVAEAAATSSAGGDIDLGDAIRGAKNSEELRQIMEEAQAQGIRGVRVKTALLD